jgi:hypothetical protein
MQLKSVNKGGCCTRWTLPEATGGGGTWWRDPVEGGEEAPLAMTSQVAPTPPQHTTRRRPASVDQVVRTALLPQNTHTPDLKGNHCFEVSSITKMRHQLAVTQVTSYSVALVRERNIPTTRLTLVGEVSINVCGWNVSRGQREVSLRPYSRLSRPEPLLFLSSSSSIVLKRLSGPRSRPTASQKIW